MQVIDGTRKNVDQTGGRLRLGLVGYRDIWNGHDVLEVSITYYIRQKMLAGLEGGCFITNELLQHMIKIQTVR